MSDRISHRAMTVERQRRLRRTVLTVVATSGLVLGGAASAVAAPAAPTVLPAATGADGWMRVAHLSPDTKSVDVTLTALSGDATVFELTDVAYGMVSDYVEVPTGTYVVSMVPSDSASTAKPMISASVRIVADKTISVAALGTNDDLTTRVFQDDLTAPEAGASRIRVIQASTVADEVDVETTNGLLIAENAESGASTSYATVPAGPWDIALSAKGISDTAPLNLADGTVNTLFVLDNSTGGLTIMPVLDSASVGDAPTGGVQTGGGALADSDGRFLAPLAGSRG